MTVDLPYVTTIEIEILLIYIKGFTCPYVAIKIEILQRTTRNR